MFLNVNTFSDCGSDADMIQAAVDAAAKTGQSVLVPKYNVRTGKDLWEIDKTVLLHTSTTLILQNCHLRMADGAICNMFMNSNARTDAALTEAGKQSYITIRGEGRKAGRVDGAQGVATVAEFFGRVIHRRVVADVPSENRRGMTLDVEKAFVRAVDADPKFEVVFLRGGEERVRSTVEIRLGEVESGGFQVGEGAVQVETVRRIGRDPVYADREERNAVD